MKPLGHSGWLIGAVDSAAERRRRPATASDPFLIYVYIEISLTLVAITLVAMNLGGFHVSLPSVKQNNINKTSYEKW